jgi:CubicO group peptidase (beta-lactamase class C family)
VTPLARPAGLGAILAVVACVVVVALLGDPRLTGPAAVLDRDGDGRLEPEETTPLLRRAFAEVDRDSSGALDAAELRRWTLRQWLTGASRPVPVPERPSVLDAAHLEAWLEAPVRARRLHGVGLVLLRGGDVIFRHSAGAFDADAPVPVEGASEWLTAATFACLDARGTLDLGTPLRRWLPQLDGAWGEATLADLLSHSAGAPPMAPPVFAPGTSLATAGRALTAAYPRGSRRFQLAPAALQIAGWAAEEAAGLPWRRLFLECLSWPLSLDSAAWGDAVGGSGRAGYVDLATGLHISLDDYARFLAMLQQAGRFHGVANLPPDAVRELERVRTLGLPRDRALGLEYALGAWCEAHDGEDCQRLSRSGRFGALPWLDRTTGLAGVLLTVDSLERVQAWGEATRQLATDIFARAERRDR